MMSEWQEAMVWTSKESVGMVDGSDTLSWEEEEEEEEEKD